VYLCGPRRFAGGFGRKSVSKIVSDTGRMKNTPIHVCAKTSFVGGPSIESGPVLCINSCSSVIILERYFKLVYRKNVVKVTFNYLYNVSPIH
jgi:hypothetical protein